VSVIDVRGLSKRFDDRVVVDGISLRVEAGEIMGFLGPNGSGKTTTIRMICGLLSPDAGEGTVLGYDVRRESPRIKREVGYMTQRFSFYEDLTIEENLTFVARLYGLRPVRTVVERTLESLGLSGRRHQLSGTLSGGWKQRLALAACIMHEPRLLLLDEPTAGVDPKARRDFWDEIHGRAAEGLTVLVSTHYMDEAERCHRISYISYGHLLATGTADQVVRGSGLVTFLVLAPANAGLLHRISKLEGVEQVAPFGLTIHVVGRDAERMRASLQAFSRETGVEVRSGETSLEDVFIQFMAGNADRGP
jgi:ABC-2 type transport system ATP-binding protein